MFVWFCIAVFVNIQVSSGESEDARKFNDGLNVFNNHNEEVTIFDPKMLQNSEPLLHKTFRRIESKTSMTPTQITESIFKFITLWPQLKIEFESNSTNSLRDILGQILHVTNPSLDVNAIFASNSLQNILKIFFVSVFPNWPEDEVNEIFEESKTVGDTLKKMLVALLPDLQAEIEFMWLASKNPLVLLKNLFKFVVTKLFPDFQLFSGKPILNTVNNLVHSMIPKIFDNKQYSDVLDLINYKITDNQKETTRTQIPNYQEFQMSKSLDEIFASLGNLQKNYPESISTEQKFLDQFHLLLKKYKNVPSILLQVNNIPQFNSLMKSVYPGFIQHTKNLFSRFKSLIEPQLYNNSQTPKTMPGNSIKIMLPQNIQMKFQNINTLNDVMTILNELKIKYPELVNNNQNFLNIIYPLLNLIKNLPPEFQTIKSLDDFYSKLHKLQIPHKVSINAKPSKITNTDNGLSIFDVNSQNPQNFDLNQLIQNLLLHNKEIPKEVLNAKSLEEFYQILMKWKIQHPEFIFKLDGQQDKPYPESNTGKDINHYQPLNFFLDSYKKIPVPNSETFEGFYKILNKWKMQHPETVFNITSQEIKPSQEKNTEKGTHDTKGGFGSFLEDLKDNRELVNLANLNAQIQKKVPKKIPNFNSVDNFYPIAFDSINQNNKPIREIKSTTPKYTDAFVELRNNSEQIQDKSKTEDFFQNMYDPLAENIKNNPENNHNEDKYQMLKNLFSPNKQENLHEKSNDKSFEEFYPEEILKLKSPKDLYKILYDWQNQHPDITLNLSLINQPDNGLNSSELDNLIPKIKPEFQIGTKLQNKYSNFPQSDITSNFKNFHIGQPSQNILNNVLQTLQFYPEIKLTVSPQDLQNFEKYRMILNLLSKNKKEIPEKFLNLKTFNDLYPILMKWKLQHPKVTLNITLPNQQNDQIWAIFSKLLWNALNIPKSVDVNVFYDKYRKFFTDPELRIGQAKDQNQNTVLIPETSHSKYRKSNNCDKIINLPDIHSMDFLNLLLLNLSKQENNESFNILSNFHDQPVFFKYEPNKLVNISDVDLNFSIPCITIPNFVEQLDNNVHMANLGISEIIFTDELIENPMSTSSLNSSSTPITEKIQFISIENLTTPEVFDTPEKQLDKTLEENVTDKLLNKTSKETQNTFVNGSEKLETNLTDGNIPFVVSSTENSKTVIFESNFQPSLKNSSNNFNETWDLSLENLTESNNETEYTQNSTKINPKLLNLIQQLQFPEKLKTQLLKLFENHAPKIKIIDLASTIFNSPFNNYTKNELMTILFQIIAPQWPQDDLLKIISINSKPSDIYHKFWAYMFKNWPNSNYIIHVLNKIVLNELLTKTGKLEPTQLQASPGQLKTHLSNVIDKMINLDNYRPGDIYKITSPNNLERIIKQIINIPNLKAKFPKPLVLQYFIKSLIPSLQDYQVNMLLFGAIPVPLLLKNIIPLLSPETTLKESSFLIDKSTPYVTVPNDIFNVLFPNFPFKQFIQFKPHSHENRLMQILKWFIPQIGTLFQKQHQNLNMWITAFISALIDNIIRNNNTD